MAELPGASVLSRNPRSLSGSSSPVGDTSRAPRVHAWNPELGTPPDEALEGLDTVFHLAGEPIASGRWTSLKRQRIRDSRVLGTRHLIAGLAAVEERPKVLVCASAVGFYGDRGDEPLDESSGAGNGFLAEVCAAWEHEAMLAQDLGMRVVCLRLGIVLSTRGGALARMLVPFKLGIGGRLGDGRQWMPWVHIDDVVGLLLFASKQSLAGPVNACAPHPVRNLEFTRELARALKRPAVLPVPVLALRMALGGMGDVALASQRVEPRVALEHDYRFAHAELRGALEDLLRRGA